MKKINKLSTVTIALLSTLLIGCNKESSVNKVLKIISPVGAPALAFYDQGNNENFVTDSAPTNVAAELQKSDYDVVIFDSVNGLKMIKRNNLNFALSRIITGGNLYLVSLDHGSVVNKNKDPNKDSLIVSFGQGLMTDLVFNKLLDDNWKWDINKENISYVKGVSDLVPVLKTGKYAGKDVDYVLVAQPILYNATKNENNPTSGKINVFKNIREEWNKFYKVNAIPQAGVFVRKSAVESNKKAFEEFANSLDKRLDNAINNLDVVEAALKSYSEDPMELKSRFGFDTSIVNVQKGDKYPANGCALLSKEDAEKVDVNAFLKIINEKTYGSNFFADNLFITL